LSSAAPGQVLGSVAMGVPARDVDVIVIGGGVNGTGVARDCAQRGLRVALFEKNDIGFGASGNSSGMIHGGPRYLTKNPEVTYTSCLDSGHIQEIAPHLLFRVPFLVPVFQGGLAGAMELASYDAFFEVYDRYQHLKHSKTHLRFSGEEVAQLEPGLVRTRGAVSFDEWGIDGVRLCIASLKDAEERGAQIFTHTPVTGVLRDEAGRVRGVRFMDAETKVSGALGASVIVNATGAWAPVTARLLDLPQEAARVRPGKGIHVFLDRRFSNFCVIAKAIDGRQVFLLPWQNMSVLGTTDDDYYGDLDDVVATTEEVRYLREAISKVVPQVKTARAIGTSGGVRPTLYEWGPHEDALSREHSIVDHAAHGAEGLFSMLGGKLASYRLFSEEMTDILAARLGVEKACQTHRLALPGGEHVVTRAEQLTLSEESGLQELVTRRLCFRHGARTKALLEETKKYPTQSRLVCECEGVVEAEVRYTVKNEWARSVDDVSRRTRLGQGTCGGMRCAVDCGRIVASERGQTAAEGLSSASDFLSQALRKRLPAVGAEQSRMEALSAAHLYAQAGISLNDSKNGRKT
jgi:glycerol-3-phosphate dehydrogenase